MNENYVVVIFHKGAEDKSVTDQAVFAAYGPFSMQLATLVYRGAIADDHPAKVVAIRGK